MDSRGNGQQGQGLSGAHLFHESLSFKGPAVVLVNILLFPVLGEREGAHLDHLCPLYSLGAPQGAPLQAGGPTQRTHVWAGDGASAFGEGHLPSVPGLPTHQGVVEDLPEVGVQVVCVVPGSGQEAAKFVPIAEVEEDALGEGGGCEKGDRD